MDYIKKLIKEKSVDRKIGVFGTGHNSRIAESILSDIGIDDYVYFDNGSDNWSKCKNGKRIIQPSEITKEFYILISSAHIVEISGQLNKMNLNHLDDWIYVLDTDFYRGLYAHMDAPKIPDISFDDLTYIENGFEELGILERLPAYDPELFEIFEKELAFERHYSKDINKRYKRKILEYYYADRLLHLIDGGSQFVYIDVGACGSPFVKRLRELSRLQAFAIDLNDSEFSFLDYYMRQNATQTHFADESVDAISIQSAFEMFMGDDDINAIKEFARILKRGGRILVLPLYMHRKYISAVSPNFYGTGTADIGSEECIRTDCWSWVPLSRFYSLDSLNNRVLKTAQEHGLTPKVYSIPNDMVEKDGFVYLKFMLEMRKI